MDASALVDVAPTSTWPNLAAERGVQTMVAPRFAPWAFSLCGTVFVHAALAYGLVVQKPRAGAEAVASSITPVTVSVDLLSSELRAVEGRGDDQQGDVGPAKPPSRRPSAHGTAVRHPTKAASKDNREAKRGRESARPGHDGPPPSTGNDPRSSRNPTPRAGSHEAPPTRQTESSKGPASTEDSSSKAPAARGKGESDRASEGEDAMKGRIVARYRSQLTAWFLSRFLVRGRVPFETLKGLRATAVVTFSGRTMSGFTVSTTGHAAFDREVASTLQSLRGRDAPMPPDGHHSLLEKPFPVVFQCTSRSQCE